MNFAVRAALILVVGFLTGAACRTVLEYTDREWGWSSPSVWHALGNFVFVLPLVLIGVASVYGLFRGRN